MPKIQTIQLLLIAFTVLTFCALPTLADTLSQNILVDDEPPVSPQPVRAGDLSYITGGVGEDERAALEQEKANYNLRILNASKSGDYVDGTHVTLRNNRGEQVLDAYSGPLFYAHLPSGHYTVQATNYSVTQTRPVTIIAKSDRSLRFDWE